MVRTRFVDKDEHLLWEESVNRLEKVGQSLVENHQPYEVVAIRLEGGVSVVTVVPATLCPDCGGIVNNTIKGLKNPSPFECGCP